MKRPRRHIFKRTRVRMLIVWYLILLGAIIILIWKNASDRFALVNGWFLLGELGSYQSPILVSKR